ncbi:MAG: hypothetical protein Q4F06_04405 [Eubacteriales bacterium]|nr:hypothetical protein [Eubacteriales bacterium]
MSKISYLGSINNKIQNNEMLMFAQRIMTKKQFMELYKSYKQLFWFQLSLPIGAVLIIALLCIIFKPYAEIIIAFGLTLFIFLFIVWIILSQFLVGRLWHKYVKLYKSGKHPNVIIFDLFS